MAWSVRIVKRMAFVLGIIISADHYLIMNIN